MTINRGQSASYPDPFGDPADEVESRDYMQQQNQPSAPLDPESFDPFGDPAVQNRNRFGSVKPASEDPYGDPADS